MSKNSYDPATVTAIVDMTTSKCFDWAQSNGDGIAETMAAVAARLATDAVNIRRELTENDGLGPDDQVVSYKLWREVNEDRDRLYKLVYGQERKP